MPRRIWSFYVSRVHPECEQMAIGEGFNVGVKHGITINMKKYGFRTACIGCTIWSIKPFTYDWKRSYIFVTTFVTLAPVPRWCLARKFAGWPYVVA